MRAYRFLTADDTSEFCHKITAALSDGWVLYGDPTYAYDGTAGVMRCGQAVVKDLPGQAYDPDMKLRDL